MEAADRHDPEVFPPLLYDAYRSTRLRAPQRDPEELALTLTELTGPGPAVSEVTKEDADLTTNAGTGGEAIGERIIVTGRVLDERGDPVPRTLVEVWQANAAGRYIHGRDQHPAPLDPNFLGIGRCLTDEEGVYRFTSIRPGAYPWGNHPNAWRPPHIHFSLLGPASASRLVTQMYLPGDPLHDLDPIMASVPARARDRMIARYDHDVTVEQWALGYVFDVVLAGPNATPPDPEHA
ncbi:MAG: protocatechuate 3,4-dioxygenase subunit beta [Nitriliruptorales bacterium]